MRNISFVNSTEAEALGNTSHIIDHEYAISHMGFNDEGSQHIDSHHENEDIDYEMKSSGGFWSSFTERYFRN